MKHEHKTVLRLQQILTIAELAVARLISFFYAKNEPIWLIADRGYDSGDNGYRFFLYMKKHHPEIRTYFILSKQAPEWRHLAEYGDSLLDFRSMKHYVYLWLASHLISSHVQGYAPYRGLGLKMKALHPAYRKKMHIFIQHGVSKDYTPYLEYNYTHLDLTLCSVRPEYTFFIERYGYPKERVELTGMCRYDHLVDQSQERRQILLAPTWREYIYKNHGFEQTDYYKTYASLLQSERLQAILEKYDWRLVFHPHHQIQRYLRAFLSLPVCNRIHIAAETELDLSDHFCQSNIMITDYSSVSFDFAYMQKPVLYYQFDRAQFQSEHYEPGWLDYDHSLGPVCKTEQQLLDELEQLILNGLQVQSAYRDYASSLYPYHDQENCERNYQAIIRHDKMRIKNNKKAKIITQPLA